MTHENTSREHHSIRIILLNDENKLLLMRAEDPSTTEPDGTYNGGFWFLIGGQIENNESPCETAIREIYEETGLTSIDIELGSVVWYGEFDLILSGTKRHLKQQFLLARSKTSKVSLTHLTENEKKVVKTLKWFSLDEMRNCDEVIYPVGIEDYLEPILSGQIPSSPIKIVLDRKPLDK